MERHDLTTVGTSIHSAGMRTKERMRRDGTSFGVASDHKCWKYLTRRTHHRVHLPDIYRAIAGLGPDRRITP